METTWWTITSVNDDFEIQNTLFTYSEEEMEEQRINKTNASLILNPQFIPVYPQMIREWYSYLESIIYGFVIFFLSCNEKFYCSNEQLWEMLWVSEKTISLAVKKLKDDWLIDISYRVKANGGKIRLIKKCQPRLYKNVNSDFTKMYSQTLQKCKGIENKEIENKKRNIKEKKTPTSIDELVEAYRNDERINQSLLEEDIVEWLKFKRWRKEYYATVKSFLTQMVVIKKMITNWKPQLDIPKRFSFAVNNAIWYGWKWIHRDDNTEKQYLASKKDLFKTPNQDE